MKEGGEEDGDGNSEETEAVPFLLKSLFSSGNVEKPTAEEEEGKQTRLLLELISLWSRFWMARSHNGSPNRRYSHAYRLVSPSSALKEG